MSYTTDSWYEPDDNGNYEYMLVEDHEEKIDQLKSVGADLLSDLIKALKENDEIGIEYTLADLAEHLELKI